MTVLATGLAIVGVLGLCLCLYLGLVKQSDLKVLDRYIDILKFRATEERPQEKIVINEEVVAEPEPEPEPESQPVETSEEVEMEELVPAPAPQTEPEPEQYVVHDTEVIREILLNHNLSFISQNSNETCIQNHSYSCKGSTRNWISTIRGTTTT